MRELADIRNILAPETSAVAWLRQVATSSSGQPIDGDWTRFDFRDLKLVVTAIDLPGPNFMAGRGPFFRIEDGVFSSVAGFEQNPMTGSAAYFELSSENVPTGPIPVFRVIWETLDPPYVSRQGDANGDGRVDLTDFGTLKANFGKRVDRWMVADFSGNGVVDGNDFEVLQNNFGWSESAAVPEPSALWLALLGTSVASAARACRSRRR